METIVEQRFSSVQCIIYILELKVWQIWQLSHGTKIVRDKTVADTSAANVASRQKEK